MAFADNDTIHIDAKFLDQFTRIPIRQGQGLGQDAHFNLGPIQFRGRQRCKAGIMERRIDGIAFYTVQDGFRGRPISDTAPQLPPNFKGDKRTAVCLEAFVL